MRIMILGILLLAGCDDPCGRISGVLEGYKDAVEVAVAVADTACTAADIPACDQSRDVLARARLLEDAARTNACKVCQRGTIQGCTDARIYSAKVSVPFTELREELGILQGCNEGDRLACKEFLQ